MKTSSTLLMCLLGLILGKSQGNGNQTNSPDFWDRLYACRNEFSDLAHSTDFSGHLSCLYKIKNLNLSNNQETILSRDVNRIMDDRDRSCSALTNKGTCMEREVANCRDLMKRNEYYSPYQRDCKGIDSVIHCIDDLLAVCNNSYQGWAVSDKRWYEGMAKDYCDRSDAERNCLDDMEACDKMVQNPTNSSTCQKIAAAHACLDKVESDSICSNATDREIRYHRDNIVGYRERCELMLGPCTYDHMYNCTDIVYQSTPYCNQSAEKEANRCMSELKKECTTKIQNRVFEKEMEYMNGFCGDNGLYSTTPTWIANQTAQ